MIQEELLELTSDIVSAHVGNNLVSVDTLPQLIEAVYGSLASLGKEPEPAEPEHRGNPAVSIRASIKADALTCLECGSKQKMMKRHLARQHGLTPDEYRARWKLADDYPMTSADYSAKRAALAKEIGLGSKGGRRKKVPGPVEATAGAEMPAAASDMQPSEAPATGKAKRTASARSASKDQGNTQSTGPTEEA
ncbi:MucR family transcriptional regulator [Novosphingobium sp. BL-8H]|uniref:MucR family transcriptional regulator n=1 Tax=Novosphingobium sp. BL-8H TaxID=3127640 RepID=UPI003757D208